MIIDDFDKFVGEVLPERDTDPIDPDGDEKPLPSKPPIMELAGILAPPPDDLKSPLYGPIPEVSEEPEPPDAIMGDDMYPYPPDDYPVDEILLDSEPSVLYGPPPMDPSDDIDMEDSSK